MSTHNICFHGEIIKNVNTFGLKKASDQELCLSRCLLGIYKQQHVECIDKRNGFV